MIKQLTTLIALAIGAFIILSALSNAARVIPKFMEGELPIAGFIIPLVPVLVSVFFAYYIYRYSTRIEVDESEEMGKALLLSGCKLFGCFLFLKGLTMFLGIPHLFMMDETASSYVFTVVLISLLHLAASYLLIKRTSWLANVISQDS